MAKGLRPAFARKSGYLLMASSPEALLRFGMPAAPTAEPYHSPVLKMTLEPALKDRRGSDKQLEPWSWALDQFDRAELMQRSEGNSVAWIFRMHSKDAIAK